MTKELDSKYFGFLQHYYRAEVYRETNWRNRLDVTTNWALVVTAAMLSYVFSTPQSSHIIILINFFIVWFFLYTESRRFRYYSLLKKRTRLIEQKVLGPLFEGQELAENGWSQELKDDLENPKVPMSRLESVAWRLRRTYIYFFPILFVSWLAKISTSPGRPTTAEEFFSNARVWLIPGEAIFAILMCGIIWTIALALYLPNKSHEDDLP